MISVLPLQLILLMSIYTIVNVLFLVKYTPFDGLYVYSIVAVYGMAIFSVFSFFNHLQAKFLQIQKPRIIPMTYSGIAAVFSIGALVVLHSIDPLSVEVDRWSAIHSFLKNLFAGEFPYLAKTHLGQNSSPMPGMHFLVMPFYLLGDVGLFQVFVFLYSVYVVYSFSGRSFFSLLFIVLLCISPAFWWEIAVRSDLTSNIMLVCVTIVLFEKISSGQPLVRHPWLMGLITGFFCLTRGIVAIPLILYFAKQFFTVPLKNRLVFIGAAFVSFCMLFLPFAFWDISLFIQNNPLILQTNKTHPLVQIAAIGIALLTAFRVRTREDVFFYSAVITFSLMFFEFLRVIMLQGIHEAIFNSKFDISYLSTAIPYVLFWIAGQRKPFVVFAPNTVSSVLH